MTQNRNETPNKTPIQLLHFQRFNQTHIKGKQDLKLFFFYLFYVFIFDVICASDLMKDLLNVLSFLFYWFFFPTVLLINWSFDIL